jgi:hypothetical protein
VRRQAQRDAALDSPPGFEEIESAVAAALPARTPNSSDLMMSKTFLFTFISLFLTGSLPVCNAQPARSSAPTIIETSSLNKEVTDLFDKEMTAHLNDIKSYDPAPDKVFAAGASGEYTWGSFMNAVGAYAALTGKRTLGTHDLAREIGQIGLLEYRLKGTRFSQLYGVLALRYLGRDLATNPIWQGLNEEQRTQWRQFLDVSAFYGADRQHQPPAWPDQGPGAGRWCDYARRASVHKWWNLLG